MANYGFLNESFDSFFREMDVPIDTAVLDPTPSNAPSQSSGPTNTELSAPLRLIRLAKLRRLNSLSPLLRNNNFRALRPSAIISAVHNLIDMNVELLVSFAPHIEGVSNKSLCTVSSEWDRAASFFQADAKELLLKSYLILSTFSATICGWFRSCMEPSFHDVAAALKEYTMSSWGTSDMNAQSVFSFTAQGMTIGWNIVTDVSVQHIGELQRASSSQDHKISAPDLAAGLGQWCHEALLQTLAWMIDRVASSGNGAYEDTLNQVENMPAAVKEDIKCVYEKMTSDVCLPGGDLVMKHFDFERLFAFVKSKGSNKDLHKSQSGVAGPSGICVNDSGRGTTGIHSFPSAASTGLRSVIPSAPRKESGFNLGNEAKRIEMSPRPVRVRERSPSGRDEQRPRKKQRQTRSRFSDRLQSMNRMANNPAERRDNMMSSSVMVSGIPIPNEQEVEEMRRQLRQPMTKPRQLRLYELQQKNARDIVTLRNALLKLPKESDTFRLTIPDNDGDYFDSEDKAIDVTTEDNMDEDPSATASGDECAVGNNETASIVKELLLEIVNQVSYEANAVNDEMDVSLDRARARSESILAVDLEVLLAGITICSVDSLDRDVAIEDTIYPALDGYWLDSFLSTNSKYMEAEATNCTDAMEYGTHFKCLLHLELHFAVQCALGEQFRTFKNPDLNIWHEVNMSRSRFLRVDIEKATPSSVLVNFIGTSSDPKLNVGLLKEIRGVTICLGYLENKHGNQSKLMLFVLRSISYDADDVDIMSMEKRIEIASVKLCGNRSVLSSWRPRPKDFIMLLPLESITSHLRMFRAAHHINLVPKKLRNVLYGDLIPQRSVHRKPVLLNRGRDVIGSRSNGAQLRDGVDSGCLNYLDSLSDRQCNDTQKNAISMCVQEMGSLDYETSSMSAIVGPPGTGKTTCIGLLIGALLHHSKAGHIFQGAEEINLLNRRDGFMRAVKRYKAFKILICASSNAACDNIARRLMSGIPDGKGGLIRVNLVRIGCQGHDYQDLEPVSLRQKALAFDHELFNKEERWNPSSKAVKAMAAECIVVLSTSSTSGSCTLRDLKVQFDVIVVEESAHSFEPECIIPIVSACAVSKTRRAHVVLVGDHKQLPPVIKAEHAVGKFLSENKGFQYSKPFSTQIWSLFERAVERARCPVAWICRQYRTHPAISVIQSREMYRNIVLQPPSELPYLARYNQPRLGGYYPFTFVDTCKRRSRFEIDRGDGNYENPTEAALVETTLQNLLRIAADGELDNQIIVTSPYRSQVDFLKEYLQDRFHVLAHEATRKKLNVMLDTVDTLMGLERKVVIVSLTRSNDRRCSGFLDSRRRINVATSRAQHLLILIGDSTTVCHRVPMLETFWSACFRNERGANVIFAEPITARDMEHGRIRQLRRMRNGAIRYRQDHGLRPRR